MHLNKKIIFGVVFLAVFGASFVAVNIPTAHAYVYCQDSSGNVTKKAFECRSEEKIVSEEDFKNPNKYENVAQPSDSVCSLSGTNGLAICISNLVYYIMVGVFSSIAYIAAFFFDLAVQLSLNSTTYALGFLTTSWTIIRDLSNMAFIFILIYIAVEVMLTADNSQTLKTLAAVIVVALLVNFSFFFTRVAIDAGNLLALQFYNAIEGHPIGQNPAGTGLDSTLKGGSTNAAYNKSAADFMSGFTALASGGGPLTPGNTKDLTASIMDGIQVQNIVNTESFKRYADPKQTPNSSSMYILITLSTIYIAVGIAFGVLAGAFLFAGAKFIMRIVGLWFVIILSPLALVAATLPNAGAKKLFKDWLNHLVNFSFYPAAFLFMFFVLSRFMKELNAGGNFLSGVFASSPAGLSDDTFGFITILSAIANVGIRLGFVIAMMYLALSAADMLARSRGDMTSGWARTAAGWMGNAITGGAIGWTGRQTFGRAGQLLGINSLARATYDPRNSALARATGIPMLLRKYDPLTDPLNKSYGATPIDFGKAHGYDEAQKRKERLAKAKENALQKKADAEYAARQGGGQAPTAPQQNQQPQQPTPPQTPGGGGGNRAGATIPPQNGGQARMTNAPGTTNLANPGAQPQQRGTTNQAANIASASNIQKILQGFNNENLKNMRGVVDTSSAKNLAQLKGTIDTSSAKNLSDLKSTVSVSTTNLKSDINNETLDRMKKMVRKVIRNENESVVQSIADSRPPEPPKTPAGGAVRPPSPPANDDTGDMKKAA